MLVLSRKLNQAIIINENIRVTVLDIRGGQVRLGIEAPSDVAVFREELLHAHPHDDATSALRHDDCPSALKTNRKLFKQPVR